ncbi:hypothetical protein C2W62_15185 [Candidatus Entotheonella serta]|nr:hypothetical protein C2W62_15185 [Candidatus Entotheonella serta]
MALNILDGELVLFRDKCGKVVALQNACPHRGMPLALGDCHFAGTVSCPYHGWTYDAAGDCVAVLGEGPDSAIAGMRDARARVYPTQTLKGIVFVWMGDGPPAVVGWDNRSSSFWPRSSDHFDHFGKHQSGIYMPQGPEFIRCDYPNPLPFD